MEGNKEDESRKVTRVHVKRLVELKKIEDEEEAREQKAAEAARAKRAAEAEAAGQEVDEEAEKRREQIDKEYRALRKEVRLLEIALLKKYPELQQSYLIHDPKSASYLRYGALTQGSILKELRYEYEFYALKYIDLCMQYAKENLTELKIFEHDLTFTKKEDATTRAEKYTFGEKWMIPADYQDYTNISNYDNNDYCAVAPPRGARRERLGYIMPASAYEGFQEQLLNRWDNKHDYVFNRIMTLAHELTHIMQYLEFIDKENLYNGSIIQEIYDSMRKELFSGLEIISDEESKSLESLFKKSQTTTLSDDENTQLNNLIRKKYLVDFDDLVNKQLRGNGPTELEEYAYTILAMEKKHISSLLEIESKSIERIRGVDAGFGEIRRDKSALAVLRLKAIQERISECCGAYEHIYRYDNIINKYLGCEAHTTFMEAFLTSLSLYQGMKERGDPVCSNKDAIIQSIMQSLENDYNFSVMETSGVLAENNYMGYQLLKLGMVSMPREDFIKFMSDGIQALDNNNLMQFLTIANECFKQSVRTAMTESSVEIKSENDEASKFVGRVTTECSLGARAQFTRLPRKSLFGDSKKDTSMVGKVIRKKMKGIQQGISDSRKEVPSGRVS